MGYLKIAANKNVLRYNDNFKSLSSVSNLIQYIARTGKREDRRNELVLFGVLGAYPEHDVPTVIRKFLFIQKLFGVKGPRMFHEIYVMSEEEMYLYSMDFRLLDRFARACATVYFSKGFQVAYAVHMEPLDPDKRMHVHFAVNTVNFNNGRKWHTNLNQEQRVREALMNSYSYQIPFTTQQTILY